MSESTQKKLERVRPPRVHIKYEVETEGAVVVKELPFVVGVLGSFTGNTPKKLEPLRDRKFITIDRDNFNEVMQRLGPELNLRVENTMQKDGTEISVELKFDSLEDFEPARVAEKVPALKQLLETRARLKDLYTKVDRSPELESILEDVLSNSEKLSQLSSELGAVKGQSGQENN